MLDRVLLPWRQLQLRVQRLWKSVRQGASRWSAYAIGVFHQCTTYMCILAICVSCLSLQTDD